MNSNKTVNKQSNEKPLPCPFCGETNIVSRFQTCGLILQCGNCFAQTADTYCNQTPQHALDLWNSRKWIPEIVKQPCNCRHGFKRKNYDECEICGGIWSTRVKRKY